MAVKDFCAENAGLESVLKFDRQVRYYVRYKTQSLTSQLFSYVRSADKLNFEGTQKNWKNFYNTYVWRVTISGRAMKAVELLAILGRKRWPFYPVFNSHLQFGLQHHVAY
jgi:hypothetical protein